MAQELTPQEFRNYQQYIYSISGIYLPDSKRVLLSNRVRRRLRATKIETFVDYLDLVTSAAGRGERKCFLDVVTTNETDFFRTEKHYEWFQKQFIPDVIQQHRRGEHDSQLSIWSAACSTGEEAYSLAICFAQNQLRLRDWTLRILGTDISEEVLQVARAGIYSEKTLSHVSDVQRRRYFRATKDGKAWEVSHALQQWVEFQSHNLMLPLEEPQFDCIFICNVLIYFDKESKRTVVRNLLQQLAPGGYLVVGPSEGIYDLLSDLDRCESFLYRRPVS